MDLSQCLVSLDVSVSGAMTSGSSARRRPMSDRYGPSHFGDVLYPSCVHFFLLIIILMSSRRPRSCFEITLDSRTSNHCSPLHESSIRSDSFENPRLGTLGEPEEHAILRFFIKLAPERIRYVDCFGSKNRHPT